MFVTITKVFQITIKKKKQIYVLSQFDLLFTHIHINADIKISMTQGRQLLRLKCVATRTPISD